MRAFFSLATLSLLVPVVLGQHNITVNDTDPSIQYQGDAGDASICKVNPDGTFVGGQPGCYNVPSNCTASVAMGQSQDSAASFTFQGSAIYINSLLFDLSPIYTVTLDGNGTDVDGFRTSKTFQCETLFSRTGLDPTINHTVSLNVKSQSPSADGMAGNIFVFSLINFTYTAEDTSTSSNNTNTPFNTTTPSTSNTSSSASNSTPSNSQSPSNDTKSSSSTSIQSRVSGIHQMGLRAFLVITSMLLSGAHWA